MRQTAASRALGKIAALLCFASAWFSSIADGQAIVRVNENVSFRLGIGLQGWADWAQDPGGGYAQNLFLRRASLYLSGQAAPGVTFFFRTDSPNLGKGPRDSGSNFLVEDGYLEWGSGRLVDSGRRADPGPVLSQLPRGVGPPSHAGFRQPFLSSQFPHRVLGGARRRIPGQGVFRGRPPRVSDRGLRRPPPARIAQPVALGRTAPIQLFRDGEGPVLPGRLYLGTKKVLALGGGFDSQGDYRALAADVFLDFPVSGGDGVTAQIDLLRWDGGRTFPTLFRQDDLFFEGGYYIRSIRLLPWARFESQSFSGKGGAGSDQKRVQLGATWYGQAHYFNIRAGYGRVTPSARDVGSTNQFTLQLQVFYY